MAQAMSRAGRVDDRHARSTRPAGARQAKVCRRVVIVAESAHEVVTGHGRLIRDARQRGHDIFCAAPHDPEAFRSLSACDIEPFTLPAGGREKHDIRQLALSFTSLSPDVVMALSWSCAKVGIAAAVRAGVKRIVAAFPELALALAPVSLDTRLRRECVGLLSRCHAAVIPGLDRDPVVEGRSMMPPGLDPIFVAGPGIDTAQVTHVPLAPLTRGIVFLAIAYPGSEAGVARYCQSAQRLGERRGNAIFLVVSPGHETPSPELLRLMKAHRGIVRYLGPRTDMDRLLARAHTIVFPDETPCLPVEVARSLAIGRPVISADVPARWRAVEHDINGLRVAAGDGAGLEAALHNVLRRPDRIPLHARESRRIAASRFDINEVLAAQLAALQL